MFLTKMVNDLFAKINTSSQKQQTERSHKNPSQLAVSNYKTLKKTSKSKKSHKKGCCNIDDTDQVFENTSRKDTYLSRRSKTRCNTVTPTKVKSASWKRSEKSVAPFNALSNKKHKSLRKKSPSWLIFSNSKTKKAEPSHQDDRESASVCRPGTSYSDVLFGAGAGCSNMVNIKSGVTSRFCNGSSTNAAQTKLTNALLKFNGNQENETSDESEVEGNKDLFPALQETKNKFHSPATKKLNDNFEKPSSSEENSDFANSTTMAFTRSGTCEESDVVILPNLKVLSIVENNMSYGNYLEQKIQNSNGNMEKEVAADTKVNENFLTSSISNIPKWNFMSAEIGSSDAFPKFVCQFDDENYLRAEKMALLSLKLALGNCSPIIK